MGMVYRIEYKFDAHPDDEQLAMRASPSDREQVTGYVAQRHAEDFFRDEEFRFLVLSPTEQELLPHRPAVRPGARGACYYTMGELRSGKRIVDVGRR